MDGPLPFKSFDLKTMKPYTVDSIFLTFNTNSIVGDHTSKSEEISVSEIDGISADTTSTMNRNGSTIVAAKDGTVTNSDRTSSNTNGDSSTIKHTSAAQGSAGELK